MDALHSCAEPAVGHRLNDTFLEVVSPVTAGTTAGRLLEKRGVDGGYMIILQTDSVVANAFQTFGDRAVKLTRLLRG